MRFIQHWPAARCMQHNKGITAMNNSKLFIKGLAYCLLIRATTWFAFSIITAITAIIGHAEETPPATITVIIAQPPQQPLQVEQIHETRTEPTALNLSLELENTINAAAQKYGLSPALVRAVIYTESRGKIDAENAYCYGLMQLNKTYAASFMDGAGIENITDPANNIYGGCWFLAELMQWADNNETLALMAYNLGQSGARNKWNSGTRSTNYTEKVQAAKELF